MRKSKFLSTVLAVVMVLSMALSGCGSSGAASETTTGEPGGDIAYGFGSSWNTLMPYDGSAGNLADLIFDKIYDRLAYVDGDGKVSPRAAKSWTWAADGKSATFTLDENAKWHDGEKVTAKDWVFTFQLISNAEVVTPRRGMLAIFEGTDNSGVETSSKSIGVEAVDENTLVFHFKNATSEQAFFTSRNMYYYVLPEHLLSDVSYADFASAAYFSSPVGSGPCKYVSQVAGNTLTLAANTDYQLGAPGFGNLTYQVVQVSNNLSSLAAGTLDVTFSALTNDEIEMVKSQYSDTLTLSTAGDSANLCALSMNMNTLTDVKLRQAINAALNKETIVASALSGYGKAAESFLAIANSYYDSTLKSAYNIDTAKALIAESGFDTSKTLTLAYQAGSFNDNIAALIQEQLTAVGLKVNLQTADIATTVSGMKNNTYDMAMFKYPVFTDPLNAQTYLSAIGTNTTNFKDEDGTVGNLYEQLYSETDESARKAEAVELQQWYTQNCIFVPVCHYSVYTAMSNKLTKTDARATALLNEAAWTWVKTK